MKIISLLKNYNYKKILQSKFFKIVAVVFVLLIICFFSFRNMVLRSVLKKRIASFEKTYNAKIDIKDIYFTRFSNVNLDTVTFLSPNNDSIFVGDKVLIDLKLFPMIVGKIRLNALELYHSNLYIAKVDSAYNFSFLLKKKKVANEDTIVVRDYADRFETMFSAIFDKMPNKVLLDSFKLIHQYNQQRYVYSLSQLLIEDEEFDTKVNISGGTSRIVWNIKGFIDKSNRVLGFKWFSDSGFVKLPFIARNYNLNIEFDTINCELKSNEYDDDVFKIKGLAYLRNFKILHPKISKEKVILKSAGFDFACNVGKDYYEIDSSSTVYYEKLNFHPYFKYRPKPSKQVTLIINKEKFEAQSLFGSLPEGLFDNLQKIEVEGDLSYHLDFFVDVARLDSLRFTSSLDKYNFKIKKFGNTNFLLLNEPFIYTAYEHGFPVKSFEVGPASSSFISYSDIPRKMIESVLNSEDGAFFYHRGFIEDAFKQSIAENIKQKRFARGGSTISMQLVKNVFLNRNKTVARKFEEILIVWLIENNRLCSKERMLEIYFNVIEWGPVVYGIKDAAWFYFKKQPSQLTTSECIYLASIVPAPKAYKYSFDENGNLKPTLEVYFNKIASKLVQKEVISQEEANTVYVNQVKLKGEALLYLSKSDSLQVDSSLILNNILEVNL